MYTLKTNAHIKHGVILLASVVLIGVVLWVGYVQRNTSREAQNTSVSTVQEVDGSREGVVTYTTPSGGTYMLRTEARADEVRQSIADTRALGSQSFSVETSGSLIDVALEDSANAILTVAFSLQTDFSQMLLNAEESIIAGDFETAQSYIDDGLNQIDTMEQEVITAEINLQDLNDMLDSTALPPALKQSLGTYIATTNTLIKSLRSLFEIRRATLTLEPSSQAEANAVQSITATVNKQAQLFAGSLRVVQGTLSQE